MCFEKLGGQAERHLLIASDSIRQEVQEGDLSQVIRPDHSSTICAPESQVSCRLLRMARAGPPNPGSRSNWAKRPSEEQTTSWDTTTFRVDGTRLST